MLSYSLTDIRLISELSQFSELELIHPSNDEKVAKYLYKIGIDINQPWYYHGCYHRNLKEEVVLGLRVIGEVRRDEEFQDSWLAGITERLICVAYDDVSLMKEIAQLSYQVRDIDEYVNEFDSTDFDEERALFPIDQLEEDWESKEANVAALNQAILSIRGCPFTESGGMKLMGDYCKESIEIIKEKYGD